MDRAFADAIVRLGLWRDPVRVCEVIAETISELQAQGYSAEEVVAAVAELIDGLEGCDQTRH